jgi:hypothetical protein
LRSNNLNDGDVEKICNKLKTDTKLISLDISKNNITKASISLIASVIDTNKTLQYLGLAMNNLGNSDIVPLVSVIGANPFPIDGVEAQLKRMKERDAIIEKNKKLKGKKEEAVPIVDNIIDKDGNWVVEKNQTLKHLNLLINNFTDEVAGTFESIMNKSNDLFVLSAISKGISKETVKILTSKIGQRLILE